MNLTQLCTMFCTGSTDGESGAFKIVKLNDNLTILENQITKRVDLFRVVTREVRDDEGELTEESNTHIFVNRYCYFDVIFGTFSSNTKSAVIRDQIQFVVQIMRNTERWIIRGDYTRDNLNQAIENVGVTHLLEYVQSGNYENQQLILGLRRSFNTNLLLKDENGECLAASPVKCCKVCSKTLHAGMVQPRQMPELKDGIVVDDEQGIPKTSVSDVCNECSNKINNNDLEMDSHNVFQRPLTKAETTFNEWPFDRTCGVELETIAVGPIDHKTLRNMGWRLVGDGSIRTDFGGRGVEYNSPPMMGDAFLNAITKGVKCFAANSRVNQSCGFHVHVNWSDYDRLQKANIQNFTIAMEELLFALQPPSRAGNNYCRKWGRSCPVSKPDKIFSSEKYMGVNFSHAENPTNVLRAGDGSYGTIEFRMGGGTRNTSKILKWSEFCIRLVEIGAEHISQDGFVALRSMSISQKFAMFEQMAAVCDGQNGRPTSYLTSLIEWMRERLKKFDVQITTATITVPELKKQDFTAAKLPEIESVNEVYEEAHGHA